MTKIWILLCLILSNVSCQKKDDIVQCNPMEINHLKLEQMSIKEQEELAKSILNEYDKNLTALAYITSSVEFSTHIHLNDSNLKRKTENYYELYRACLKTIALGVRQFKSLINNNQSSLRWLLLRTQAIGDAGEGDTMIKLDIQKLKAHLKEIYHQKFLWNDTQLGVDGVQEVLGTLESADDLLSLWNATYQVPAEMRDYYSTLINLQNQQAKQNRTLAVTRSHI